jgi:hypothetical protein
LPANALQSGLRQCTAPGARPSLPRPPCGTALLPLLERPVP